MNNTKSQTWVVTLTEDDNGDLILPVPTELVESLGWLEADELEFEVNGKSVIIINKTANIRKLENSVVLHK